MQKEVSHLLRGRTGSQSFADLSLASSTGREASRVRMLEGGSGDSNSPQLEPAVETREPEEAPRTVKKNCRPQIRRDDPPNLSI